MKYDVGGICCHKQKLSYCDII